MRKLGIDYGDSRVGLAISDELGITAQGLCTINHKGNDKIVLKQLEEILNSYEIDTIVIGIPINMDGTEGIRVEVTKKFIHKLKCKFNKVNIVEIDERLTTVEATHYMLEGNIRRAKRKEKIDSLAANIILQTYLDRKRNEK